MLRATRAAFSRTLWNDAPLPTIEPAASTAVDQTRLVENRRGGALLSGARAALTTVIAAGTAGDERETH